MHMGMTEKWAEHMRGLQTTTLQADLVTIDAALASGAASKPDADRVRRWISDLFQDNIQRTISQQIQVNEGAITSMEYSADLINGVADGDMNGAYRFAGGDKYQNNATRLDNALRGGAVASVFDEVFGASNSARAAESTTGHQGLPGADRAEVLAGRLDHGRVGC